MLPTIFTPFSLSLYTEVYRSQSISLNILLTRSWLTPPPLGQEWWSPRPSVISLRQWRVVPPEPITSIAPFQFVFEGIDHSYFLHGAMHYRSGMVKGRVIQAWKSSWPYQSSSALKRQTRPHHLKISVLKPTTNTKLNYEHDQEKTHSKKAEKARKEIRHTGRASYMIQSESRVGKRPMPFTFQSPRARSIDWQATKAAFCKRRSYAVDSRGLKGSKTAWTDNIDTTAPLMSIYTIITLQENWSGLKEDWRDDEIWMEDQDYLKICTPLPLIHIIKACIGTCLAGARAVSHAFCCRSRSSSGWEVRSWFEKDFEGFDW